jgi:ATP/maltotriose-dependent transcriptional regulator MalT
VPPDPPVREPAGSREPAGLYGRDAEFAVLEQVAERVRAGRCAVVAIDGEAGIGKTTFLRAFLEGLPGFTVLRAAAVPAEAEVGYGILQQLLADAGPDLLARYPLLAGPLRSDVAPLAVGADLLVLLGDLQAAGPVALVVDDVQWADEPSLDALGFVARRLRADRVVVLFTCRTGGPTRAGTDLRIAGGRDEPARIRLRGLDPAEVAALANATLGRPLSRAAAVWLCAHTQGHPLYLRALLSELTPEQLEDTGQRLPVPRSLTATIQARLARLPEPSRRLLEALAVLDARCPLARVAQLAGVAEPALALEAALHAELVEWWPAEPLAPVAFRHPLHRDAVYTALPPTRRTELHAGAVPLVDHRAAWLHRVAAATGVDPEVAARLEEAAAEESGRGEHLTAANYLLWAAQLSDTRAEYERRLLTAALRSVLDWRMQWAVRLRAEIEGCAASALRDCVMGILATLADNELGTAHRLLTGTLRATEGRPELGWVRGLAAVFLASLNLWRGRGRETVEAGELALSTGLLDERLADVARMVIAVGRSRYGGFPAALADLAHLPAAASDVARADMESLACRGALRAVSGRLAEAADDLSTVVRLERAGAPVSMGAHGSFAYLATVRYLRGEWDDALIAAQQGMSLVESGEQVFHYGLLHLAGCFVPAGRGGWSTAQAHVAAAEQVARAVGSPQERRYAAIAAAVLAQARGEPAGMLAALAPLRGLDPAEAATEHVWWQLSWRPLLVEALTGTGFVEEAAAELDRLRAVAGGVEYLGVVLARLAGALAEARGDAPAALDAYRQGAEAAAGEEDAPLYRAMLAQAYGRLLLTEGSRRDALHWLRSAHRGFSALGAEPFARRCEAELERHGGGQRSPRGSRPGFELSDREFQVARLAERGWTNRQIAAELYVSAKTVEYHLAHVYLKLGVANRHQLRGRITAPGAETAPAPATATG